MPQTLLFIQLPIPRLRLADEDHNIPVAAYCLQAYLMQQSIAQYFTIEILLPDIQNRASDDTLLREVVRRKPDVIGFSLFCWNVERSLWLAEQIKQSWPDTHLPLILAGGPEVTPDNPLLHRTAINLYVYGEGEHTLHTILEYWLTHADIPRNLAGTMYLQPAAGAAPESELAFIVNPPQTRAIDLNATLPAYLSGMVPDAQWREMFVETMRGCPFACRFCYYNKNCGKPRFLKQETVLALLRHAVQHKYAGIFLLDPSFNIRPDLEALLRKMADINAEKQVKIATELRADMIDEPLARLLAEAGFHEVELGLQSIHAETIRNIGRRQHRDAFLRGTRAMLEHGIDAKVDLIVGLPGDTLEKFKQSARWVKRNGLDGSIQVFCLSVLPGTYFREHANGLGLKYAPFPPYYLRSSPDWTLEDIRHAFSWAEDYFGITFEPDTDDDAVPALSAMLDQARNVDAEVGVMRVIPTQPFQAPASAPSVTTWIIGPLEGVDDLWRHLDAIQEYTHRNPFGVYRVYLHLCAEIPIPAILDFAQAFTPLKTLFIDRDLSVLSLDDAPLFHYRIEAMIQAADRGNFSDAYCQELRRHLWCEILPTDDTSSHTG